MTVTEFKKIVADWPEVDSFGDPSEVWMETGVGLSSPVSSCDMINFRLVGGRWVGDLLICASDEAWS